MNMPIANLEEDVQSTIIRVGDAMLWAWGECRRNGWIERVMGASVAALSDEGTPRAPGTHSDPTLARLMSCESEDRYEARKQRTALSVECEMVRWRADKHLRLWADVALGYYAHPYKRTNAEVGRSLSVSERTIEGVRSQMRRMLVMVARRP